MLTLQVPGTEETFRSWLECFRTAASKASGTKRSWSFRRRRSQRQRAPSPEELVVEKRRSLVGDSTSGPTPYALYESSPSSNVIPDIANKVGSLHSACLILQDGVFGAITLTFICCQLDRIIL